MGSKLMFGNVWASLPDKGMVRVEFQEDDITSLELPYIAPGTSGENLVFVPLAVGTHVACLMDENCEYGVVLGPIYSEKTPPDGGAINLYRTVYSDGTVIEYNTTSHLLTCKVGTSELKINQSGFEIKRGGESLTAIVTDLLNAIIAETHTTSTGPSGPPINIAQYNAILSRLPNLLI